MTENPTAGLGRPTLYLIDGYALLYRAFYAMISRPLITSSGENTSAPFGLARFLSSLLDEHRPDYVGVVLDAGDSFRAELFEGYKATREKMPDDLTASLPRCRAIVEAFGTPIIEVEGWEADDVIGTLATQAADAGMQTVIVSGDKDFYQLIDDRIFLLNPGRGGAAAVEEEWVTPENAEERLGVSPRHVTDYLALLGDSSDNIPGVPGIGAKTAPKLIRRWGGVDEILEHLPEIKATRARNALEGAGEQARISKRLVTIRRDAPLAFEPELLRRGEPDRDRLRALFLELEFHSLVREHAGAVETPVEAARHYELVTDVDRLRELVAELRGRDRIAIDTEATSPDPMRARLIGLSISSDAGRAWYLPFAHRPPGSDAAQATPELPLDDGGAGGSDSAPDMFAGDAANAVPNLPPIDSPQMRDLRELLASTDVGKVGHNIKYDLLVLERTGAPIGGIAFDTSLASYCLDPGKRQHELDSLALQWLNHKLTPYEELCGRGALEISFAEVPLDRALEYAAEDADYTLRLAEPLERDLAQYSMLDLFRQIEMPLVPVLASMERSGIRLDLELFEELSARISRELALVEEEIRKIAGSEVNLRSVPQLRELLFDTLGLPVVRRTKTGPSTDESVLAELAAREEENAKVPRLILEYRELDKLNSTYVAKLPDLVNPETGRVHTNFNQTVAATGRLSSSDPNLQNIPVRSALGREIRRGFIPDEGYGFLSADYSQVELRILAHLSGDPAFIEVFGKDGDIHRETAARIFGVDSDAVTPLMRDRAKTINFATIYGQGANALAAQLGIDRGEAAEFIRKYFERFAGVREYLDRMQELARTRGYVETVLGRRRYIPEITSRNRGMRAFGERMAANSPIQGTAADLIKIAMIRLHERLAGSPTRMLLQVHDELLFEVRAEDVDEVRGIVREEMEGAVELDVPLRVDFGSGASWFECKGG